jgi:hypothetical protein
VGLLVAAALVGLAALLFVGPDLAGCLGPLGVTEVQCAAARMAADPGWSPSPIGPAGAPLTAIAGVLLVLGVTPSAASRRAVVAILASAALGAATGAVGYEAFRPREMNGLTSSGQFITLALPASGNAQAFVMAYVATIAAAGMGLALRIRSRAGPAVPRG